MKAIIYLTLVSLFIISINSCLNNDLNDFEIGYLSGTFLCPKIVNGHAGDRVRGFCILLKNRESSYTTYYPMDLYTFNLPDDFFTLPPEILNYTYDGTDCGPIFFPDSLILKYKFMFKYRDADKNEIIEFLCGPCFQMETTFPWRHFKQITIEETNLLQK